MVKLTRLPSFAVIGIVEEGATGASFSLDKKEGYLKALTQLLTVLDYDKNCLCGIALSATSYLIGLKCSTSALAPEGFKKVVIPSFDYWIKETSEKDYESLVGEMKTYFIPVEGYELIGRPFDFLDLNSYKKYLYFPVMANPILPKRSDLTAKIAPCGLHCGYCFFSSCEGCLSSNNKCSYGAFQPGGVCPNVKCSKDKGLEGCYECDKLENCEFGFYSCKPGNAHASALFIKKHGKKEFEEAIKKLMGREKPYYTLMIEQGNDDKQVAFLEDAIKK